uniref:DUF4283 domain-containing protein n=1 Tax=Setaria italica TaxID=4555 RepID=K3ZZH5_SETIT
CRTYGHKAAECPNPLHRAKDCRSSYHGLPTRPVHRAPVLDYGEIPSLQRKDIVRFIPPGTAHQRPEMVRARVRFSGPMATSERDLARHAVVAAVAGGSPAVSRRQVAKTFAFRFQIADDDVEVSLNSPQAGDFLVYFKDPIYRTEALRYPGPPCLWMHNSNSALKITPWTRQSQATAVVNLYYKVRLCIEGMPRHAWQEETVRCLFHHPTLIESIDRDSLDAKDSACLCVWVWTNDPRCFARQVELELELELEELQERAVDDDEPWHCLELGFVDQRRRQPRFQPVRLLSYKYNVLLHIDRVFDFSPATAASFQPWIHDFNWQLGVKDSMGFIIPGTAHQRPEM